MSSPLQAAVRNAGRVPLAGNNTPIAGILNAFVEIDSSKRSETSTGLLGGAKIAVKANICAKDWLATAGSKALANYRAPYNATAVDRVLSSGGVVGGVTNMDEFGMGSATAFSTHGPTFNPYSALYAMVKQFFAAGSTGTAADIASLKAKLAAAPSWLTPGGSSGGSAVAVATGQCDAALGSDTGGSVRQPAAFCGIVGFKPSYGRIPRWGLIPYASSLDTVGVMSRSVSDAALLYDVTAGYDQRDDTAVRLSRAAPTKEEVGAADGAYALTRWLGSHSPSLSPPSSDEAWSLAGLRVGLPIEYHVAELDAATVAAWHRGAELLASHGAHVVPVSLPHTAAALPAYYVLAPAEAASNLSRYDGVRYGYRASDSANSSNSSDSNYSPSSTGGGGAAALHELYTRTRSEAFGAEVQRRVMTGNFVLSAAARAAFYESAVRVRQLVTKDFDAAFRRHSESAAVSDVSSRLSYRAFGRGDPSTGVDVILTPTSPALPWPSVETGSRDPLSVYLSDVMTIPASLAGLPAISVPVGTVAYPEQQIEAAIADASALLGLDVRADAESFAALKKQLALPVGLQLIGRHLDEDTLLRAAAVLEKATGFTPSGYTY